MPRVTPNRLPTREWMCQAGGPKSSPLRHPGRGRTTLPCVQGSCEDLPGLCPSLRLAPDPEPCDSSTTPIAARVAKLLLKSVLGVKTGVGSQPHARPGTAWCASLSSPSPPRPRPEPRAGRWLPPTPIASPPGGRGPPSGRWEGTLAYRPRAEAGCSSAASGATRIVRWFTRTGVTERVPARNQLYAVWGWIPCRHASLSAQA